MPPTRSAETVASGTNPTQSASTRPAVIRLRIAFSRYNPEDGAGEVARV